MAHSGIARTIVPSYGMGDGDTLFVVSTASNEAKIDIDLTKLGALAAWSVEQSIISAINSATGLAGIPSAQEYLGN